MLMKYTLHFVFCLFFSTTLSAQLQYFSPETMNGYTLFLGDSLFLINNCGEKIHTWEGSFPKYHVKLLPNGHIIYIDWFTNTIMEKDWEDNIVRQIAPTDPSITLDYEVIVLENGNFLCVGRKDFSAEDFENIGYNFDALGFPLSVDVVVELHPETGETIWLWNIADHVIQERSEDIPNYGIVAEHPELLNIDAISAFDWHEESWMINGIDYHPGLDQIVLSVRKMGEIIIIDHSTTTEEAAGHTGGNAGKGGDILYRWGNPQNYGRGTAEDQALFFQHNPNWVEHSEHVGHIAIYDNGLYRPDVPFENLYSTAPIIETPLLPDGTYAIGEDLPFTPAEPTTIYGLSTENLHFYSNYTSATKVLPNGNVLITIGDDNRVIELLPDGTLVWEYQLATAGFTFRAEKYPLDYPAFEGKDLSPMETIENPSSDVPCDLASSNSPVNTPIFEAWADASSQQLYLELENSHAYDLKLVDVLGRIIQSFQADKNNGTKHQFLITSGVQGIVILSAIHKETGQAYATKFFLH